MLILFCQILEKSEFTKPFPHQTFSLHAMYVQVYILIDALRVTEFNLDINVSSSADDTTQIGRTLAMTSNVNSQVPSTEQGMYVHIQ